MKELMKLYEKMTPHEQGIIGFTCLANQDEDGFQRVMSKVPRLSYTETHHEWQSVLNRLDNFVKIYAWTYWELRANRAECLALAGSFMMKANRLYKLNDEKAMEAHWEADEKYGKHRDEFESFGIELRALHQAARQVCEAEGLPLDEIRKLAGISVYKIEEGETAPECLDKYVSLFQTVAEN